MKKVRFLALMTVISVMSLASSSIASVWYDDFDNDVVDLTNYGERESVSGAGTLTESGGYVQVKVSTNQYAEYYLDAVEPDMGDIVRTKFRFGYAPDAYKGVEVGISSTISEALYNAPVGQFFMKKTWGTVVKAQVFDGASIQTYDMNIGIDPYQTELIFDIILGNEDIGGGMMDITFKIYDTSENLLATQAATTQITENRYWYIGGASLTTAQAMELSINPIPEPATTALLIFGSVLMVFRRKAN